MNNMAIKRWTKISLRTLHILAVAGAGGGILFGLEKNLWLHYWWLAMISGVLMMLVDVLSNPVWAVQVRGFTIYIKLILLAMIGIYSDWDQFLLILVIVVSAVISHAPGNLRYYSLWHRKVITSNSDSKG
jgi:hypothetical protein